MKHPTHRTRLLGSAAIALGLAALAASPAQADCVVATTAVTCGTTITLHSENNTGATPATDRYLNFAIDSVNITGPVTGYGLAMTPGAQPLTITNNSIVQVNTTLSPTLGGNGALQVNAVDGNVTYTGNGSIGHLGNGSALVLSSAGTANLTATIGGSVLANNGSAIVASNASTTGAGGAVTVTTTAGQTVRASGGAGIAAASAGSGDVTVTNAASIGSALAANTLQNGIYASHTGSGGIFITNNGSIGVASGGVVTDRAQNEGIHAQIVGATPGAGAINISGNGAIYSVGNGIFASTAGTGAITVNYGGSIDSSAGNGIFVSSTNGAGGEINVITEGPTVKASGGSGIVVEAAGTGGAFVANEAAISSSGASNTLVGGIEVNHSGTGLISIGNNGAIGDINNRAQVNGIFAGISSGSSAGTMNVTGSGAIYSVEDGIHVETAGTGIVTVNYVGAINASGGDGIDARSTTGSQTITVGGNINAAGTDYAGVRGIATTGAITVNVTGGNVVSAAGPGIDLSTNGAKVVEIASGRNVLQGTAAFAAILADGAGPFTVTNSGTLGIVGGTAVDSGLTTLTTVTNQTGAVMNGSVDLSDQADTVTNSGTWNASGANNFYLGTDLVANNTGGIINTVTGTTFTGLESLTTAASSTINTAGTLGFSGVATNITNAGLWNLLTGAAVTGLGAITNSGIIRAEAGASSIAASGGLNNSGSIDLADGAIGDVLTIAGNYVGSGAAAKLLIDATTLAADKLVITGAASGTTAVNITGNLNAFITTPILVVDTGTSTANAFVLGTVTGGSPLFSVALNQVGQDYYLSSTLSEGAFAPLKLNTLALGLWHQSAEEVIAHNRLPSANRGLGLWGHFYGSTQKSGSNDEQVIGSQTIDANNKLDTERYGLQGGVEYGFGGGRVGLTGGYGEADGDGSDANLKAKGWNVGLYGKFGGDTGFHGQALAKYDRYDAKFDGGPFDGISSEIKSAGVDVAAGYGFGIIGAARLDANVGFSYVRTKIEDFGAFGFSYDYGRLTSVRARGGLRATFAGLGEPYLGATVYHEFDGDGEVALSAGTTSFDLDSSGKGSWVRVEGGFGGAARRGPMIVAWAEGGDRKGAGLRAGFRF